MSEELKVVLEEGSVEKPIVTQKLEPGSDKPKPRRRRPETKKLEPELEEMALEAVKPAPRLGLTREEMRWAALAHASILLTLLLGIVSGGVAAFLGPIVPAVIWYAYRSKSEYVTEQARQATVFQVVGLVGLLALVIGGAVLVAVGWVVSAVLVIVLVGLLLLPVMLVLTLVWVVAMIVLPVVQVVYGCYAALEAHNGRPVRYWRLADVIDRYLAQA